MRKYFEAIGFNFIDMFDEGFSTCIVLVEDKKKAIEKFLASVNILLSEDAPGVEFYDNPVLYNLAVDALKRSSYAEEED